MVKSLSKSEEEAITTAVQDLENKIKVKIVPVVVSRSDSYADMILLIGILSGTLISIILWLSDLVIAYPWLLAVQFASMIFVNHIPYLRYLCMRIIPKKIRHERARRVALEEFHVLAHSLPAGAPCILLFVSLAERYVHVVTSPSIKQRLPDEHWQSVVEHFTDSIKSSGLRDTTIKSIRHMGELLAPHFPA